MKSILILILLASTALADGSGDAPMPSAPGPGKPTQICLDEMDKDPGFADYIIRRTEQKLSEKLNKDQVQKDLCTVYDHTQAAEHIAKNERSVLMAYIAMWLVAAGFVVYLWRKQQGLKREIANLRSDLDAATKDGK